MLYAVQVFERLGDGKVVAGVQRPAGRAGEAIRQAHEAALSAVGAVALAQSIDDAGTIAWTRTMAAVGEGVNGETDAA